MQFAGGASVGRETSKNDDDRPRKLIENNSKQKTKLEEV